MDSFIPKGCHLWIDGRKGLPDLETLKRHFDFANKEYSKREGPLGPDWHRLEYNWIREVVKCHRCGQLYFYEFYDRARADEMMGRREMMGREKKVDVYRTWIPIQSIEDADAISKLEPLELRKFSGIYSDVDNLSTDMWNGEAKWVVK